MKIIILEGNSNKGKTTTMGMVFVELHVKGGKVKIFTPLKSTSIMDFEAEFDYTVEGKKLKVAIYSKGDNLDDCNDAILRHSTKKTNVLIMANTTRKKPLTIPPTCIPTPLHKTIAAPATSEVKANTKDCHKIIRVI